MILVEHIKGTAIADDRPKNFSHSVRQSVLKSIVDLESRVYEKDIWLLDLEPRNIIITGSLDSDRLGIVFVDFAHALLNRRRDDPAALELNYLIGEYISPTLR